MAIMDTVKKVLGSAIGVGPYTDLDEWQRKLEDARRAYDTELAQMEKREDLYAGSRKIEPSANSRTAKTKDASNIRNIVFELVESQVDSSIPLPKISPLQAYNEDNAEAIESALRADIDRLPFEYLNDEQERTTYIQGGSVFLVEWNNNIRTHKTVGDVQVQLLHPKQVIPQPGVTSLQKCDYIFVQLSQTKGYIKTKYGIDVDEETEENPGVALAGTLNTNQRGIDTKVTQNIAYFRNTKGGIGMISWVNDILLEQFEDYQARQLETCAKCGRVKPYDASMCECGSKTWKKTAQDSEVMSEDVLGPDGKVRIPAGTEIPYYAPKCYPIVIRKNVSVFGKFLGDSDVDKIKDQQEFVKKLGTKIEEKLLKGGSILVKPKGATFPKTDEELKILEVKNIADAAGVDVKTLQPNISYDSAEKEKAYYEAKSTLGITDAYQGKPDVTATSGVAKQIAASQSAGRLESKRRMKDAAYAELYEIMFRFKLAYSDEPRSYMITNARGAKEYGEFNRLSFLEQDDAGDWFYNDSYLFSVDNSGSLANNREAMWQETRMNLQSGAFGPPGDLQSILYFWQIMESLHYPKAGDIRVQIEQLLAEQQMMQQQQMEMQQQALAIQAAQASKPAVPKRSSTTSAVAPSSLDDIIARFGGGTQ